ncbi:MAG: cytochrome c oxidase subunit 4 [Ktedonobacteraceae bacterium]
MANEFGQSDKQPEPPSRKPEKVPLEVREQRLAPKPSFWPIALAFALAMALIGSVMNPIILICGVALTLAVIIGWVLEKR